MPHPAIDAQDVSKRFVLRHNYDPSLKVRALSLFDRSRREVREDFWALKNVSLSIAPGESVGLVGRNGSGKSTFLKLVAGIYRPTSGHLLVPATARIGSMIELGVGFHPDLNGTENLFLNAAIQGLSREEIMAVYPRIVEYSGLQQFMDVPLKKYSSGMHLRLGFSIAAHLDPEILLLDEIFAVGDQDFQKQCMKTMQQFLADGRTLLFVSHAAVAVRAMCRRVCVLDRGQLLFDGGVEEGLAHYDWLINRPERERAAQVSAQRSPADGGNTLADWRERTGEWALAVLRAGGLQPHHRVLEVTCGAGTGSAALAAYVGAGNYRHWEVNWPGGDPLGPFDYAIASPLLARISLNTAARCLALLVRTMNENGRIYASWMDHAEAIDVSDVSPFEYPFALVAGVGDALGLRASRVDAASHPAGESVLVFERR